MTHAMPSQPQLIRCDHCDASFQRREHFERHLRRHSGSKPFRCEVCFKAFPRSDTLLRHKVLHERHQRHAPNGSSSRNPSACFRCVKAKQRCEGGYPCSRCTRRGLSCACDHDRQSFSKTRSTPPPFSTKTVGSGSMSIGMPPSISGSAHESSVILDTNMGLAPTESLSLNSLAAVSPRENTTSSEDQIRPEVYNIPEVQLPLSIEPSSLDLALFTGTSEFSGVEETFTSNHSFFWGFPDNELFCSPLLSSGLSNQPGGGGNLDVTGNESANPQLSNQGHERSCGVGSAIYPIDACPEFPEEHPDDVSIAAGEVYGHVKVALDGCIEIIQNFYLSERKGNGRLMSKHMLLAFLELYFEHFDSKFPFLHHSVFEGQELSWILVLALATTGAQYSETHNASRYSRVLLDLLIRAIRSEMPVVVDKPNISLVQSVFLRDIGLIFAGPLSMVLEQEGSSTDETCFEEWLRAEEIVRLLHCVNTLECIEVIFLDLPNIFTLSKFTRRRPCSEDLWQCRDVSKWLEERMKSDCTPQSGPFITESHIFEAYIEERIFLDHIHFSRISKTLLASKQQKSVESLVAHSRKFLTDILDSEMAGLGTSIQNSIFHIIAIIRQISSKTIQNCMGWQTSESGMQLSRAKFAAFIHQKGAEARRCLWHAAKVFRTLREARYLACYDALSLCVAANYIWNYDRMVTHQGEGEIVRIDHAGPRVESWIQSGGEVRLHITGVGILDGSESGSRLMTATMKAFQSQVAWSGISRALSRCFVQFQSGQKPSFADFS